MKDIKKKTTNYLSNKDLLEEVIKSKQQGQMSNTLARQLQLLTTRYAKKGNFASYTYLDDMKAYAMLMLVKTWKSFEQEKSQNPFAFFTQCIKNSFIQYLNQERRQRDIRDGLLVDKGMLPSYTYQAGQQADEGSSGYHHWSEREEEHTTHSNNIQKGNDDEYCDIDDLVTY